MQEMPSFAQFVKGLHIEYLKCYENLVGFSKFCELQPKWCIPVGGTSGIHSVCVCEHHQNFKLLTSQIPEIFDYKKLLSKIVCNIDFHNCMLPMSFFVSFMRHF